MKNKENAMKKELLSVVAACALTGLAYDNNPYGVVSHIAWANKDEPVEAAQMMGACHLGWTRVDCSWSIVEPATNQWDFLAFNTAVELCARQGVKVLPILGSRNWRPTAKFDEPWGRDLDPWKRYVREVTRRYGATCTAIEIINEPNGTIDPAHYAVQLKAAYETIKETNPDATVVYAGTAPSPCGFVEAVYRELGGKAYYDVMNIHPYTTNFRNRPEGELEGEIAKIREVMEKHGDGKKPLWITEMGWASQQKVQIKDEGIICKGLGILRPGKADWHIVYAGIAGAERELDQAVAEGPLVGVLPKGAKIEALSGKNLEAALAKGDVDAVIYPFSESFPLSTHAAVYEFVKKGGILVDMGGAPFYYGMVENAAGTMIRNGNHYVQLYKQLHLGVAANWTNPKYPNAAYLPNGKKFSYYITRDELKDGDEFIPILQSSKKTDDGRDIVSCAAIRLNSDLKGGLLIGTYALNGGENRNSELRQSLMLPRAIMIALQSGVEKFFWYEFHAREGDRGDQESHFGITRRNYVPKPAFGTYKTLIDRRPAGSKAIETAWKNKDGTVYFPQWRRPDALEGGAIWTIRKPFERTLKFSNPGEMVFHDVNGMRIWVERDGEGFKMPLTDSPIYFTGGHIVP